LFTFKFDSPGVYVFRSSKYPDYKMVCSITWKSRSDTKSACAELVEFVTSE
jgi:hypothetical protein